MRRMAVARTAVSTVSPKGADGDGFTTIVRKTRGDDIDAARGQLAGDVIDRTKRTLRKRMQGETIAR